MKIIFPVKVYQKMRAYVNGIKYEISGLGKIQRVDDVILVQDVKIFRQRVTRTETVLDRRELGKFYDDILVEGGDLADWKLWWHSHADMDVFFSSVDLNTISDFDNETDRSNWMLSIVTNKKEELLAQVDIYSPIRCTIPNIPWEISYEDREVKLAAIDEITEKVQIGEAPHQNKKNSIIFKKKHTEIPRNYNNFNTSEIYNENGELL